MKYSVKHTTKYVYQSPASLCHNIVYQIPGYFSFQRIEDFNYNITPEPNSLSKRYDFFGNQFFYFSIQKTHLELAVETNFSAVIDKPVWEHQIQITSLPWEQIVKWLAGLEAPLDIKQYCMASHHVKLLQGIREYTTQSFTPGRPILDALGELNTRIFNDFAFTPGFTEISTPIEVVFESKKGVCQDFAHFGLACLRSIGLAARYMSGYIETLPPPGKPKLVGADASHAWLAVYVPELGWVEYDATNNLLVSDNHIRVAYGRDFSDVVPMKGIVYSGGGQKMIVKVDVNSLSE